MPPESQMNRLKYFQIQVLYCWDIQRICANCQPRIANLQIANLTNFLQIANLLLLTFHFDKLLTNFVFYYFFYKLQI